MIATALSVGISKRSLLEDYYPGELGAVVAAWNELHGAARRSAEETGPMAFFGEGGEVIG